MEYQQNGSQRPPYFKWFCFGLFRDNTVVEVLKIFNRSIYKLVIFDKILE